MQTERQTPAKVDCPEADGKPLAETDAQRDWMVRIIELLKFFFLGRHASVSGNLLIRYEEGSPKKPVAAGVFIVKNCDPGRRRMFEIWEARVSPGQRRVCSHQGERGRRRERAVRNYVWARRGRL